MPIIFCSTKLSKLIGVKNRQPSISMDNWNAHLFYLEGKKCLVLVHKETFYSFVIFDVIKKQLLNIHQLFTQYFIEQLSNDKLLDKASEELIKQQFKKVELSTTDGDKSTIGFINDCVSRLTWEFDNQKPSISRARKYVESHYNNNPI